MRQVRCDPPPRGRSEPPANLSLRLQAKRESTMAWQGIEGHDDVVEQFRRALTRGRLASSFLFVGPEGVGKRAFALKLAQSLLCSVRPEADLQPCGQCPACAQVAAMTHPDLDLIAKPDDKSFLPLEMLIGDKDHRMRRGLCHNIAMKPFMGGRKVAIIDDADFLNAEGANSLLKTLEEPPPRSVLILLGTSSAKQLPTIRSRCQLVRFQPLAAQLVAEILLARGLIQDPAEAQRLAAHSGGSIARAVELADPQLWTFRTMLYQRLGAPLLLSVPLAEAVLAFMEQAGKETALRRPRLRQAILFAAEYYRQWARHLSGATDDELSPLEIETAAPRLDVLTATACADHCLQALEQLDRNAHPTALVESWLDGLAALANAPRYAAKPSY